MLLIIVFLLLHLTRLKKAVWRTTIESLQKWMLHTPDFLLLPLLARSKTATTAASSPSPRRKTTPSVSPTSSTSRVGLLSGAPPSPSNPPPTPNHLSSTTSHLQHPSLINSQPSLSPQGQESQLSPTPYRSSPPHHYPHPAKISQFVLSEKTRS